MAKRRFENIMAKRTDRRQFTAGLTAAAGALALGGRTVGAQDEPEPAEGGTLKIAIIGEPPAVADAVFTTATKATGYEAVGYGAVEQAAAAARANGLPVVAIGGITLETAARVMTAGAAAVAVIGDLLVGDPEVRAREYLSALA